MTNYEWSYRAFAVGALVLAASLYAHAVEPDEFKQRCAAYQALRTDAGKGLADLGKNPTPEEIKKHRESLRARLAELRADAEPGEILTPAMFEVVAAVRSETAGAQGKAARETVLGDGNPSKEGIRVPLKINAPYDAPLSTVPPDLLARLPELPENLQYRFVGKSLILYDVEADMVVDYISGAVK